MSNNSNRRLIRIVEMSQFYGTGFIVEVRSNDHGKLMNKANPAHAHILDASGKTELAQIVLTRNPPQTVNDIQWYRTSNPSNVFVLGKAIVKFAGSPHLPSKKTGQNITNWTAVLNQWIYFHGA